MSTDHPPIPPEAIPPGWGPVDHCDGHIAYRHSRPPVVLVASRTDSGRSHPAIGLERCWELRYRYPLGEQPIEDCLARVTTRSAALEGLLESMRRVHERIDDLENPFEVRQVLEELSLCDRVPERTWWPE